MPKIPTHSPSCVRVLLIDANRDDQWLESHALTEALGVDCTVKAVNCGDEAVAYMIGEGKYADRETFPFPTLIITELQMQDGDGFDVLEFLAYNPAWSVVPRIVFTASTNSDDVRTAHSLGASAYHVKAHALAETKKIMQAILTYWAKSETPPVDLSGRLLSTTPSRKGGRYPKPNGGTVMERP